MRPLSHSWFYSLGWMLLFSSRLSLAQIGTDAPALDADLPEPIQIRQSRSEAEEDAITAAAYFAQARVLEQRGDRAGALRGYQRAWRYDAENQNRLDEIVTLAYELQRPQVATRYALLAVEQKPKDPILIRRLAIQLSKDDQTERAAKLFTLALELSKDKGGPPNDLATALLILELGRLHYKNGDFAASAAAFTRVRDAIADPLKSGLGEENAKTVLGAGEQTWAMFGEAFLKANQGEAAAAAFRRADEFKADAALLAFRIARVAALSGKYDAALEQLDIYFAKKERSMGREPIRLLREWTDKKAGNAESGSVLFREKLRQLAEADAGNIPLQLAWGEVLAEQKDWPAAVTRYRTLLEKTPSAEAYSGLVTAQFALGDAAGVSKTLAEVVQKSGSLTAVSDAVVALQKEGEFVRKLIALTNKQREEMPPALADGQLQAIGFLAITAGEWEAGEKLLAAAVRDAKRKDLIYIPWGLALFRNEQPARAAKVFQTAIDEKGLPPQEASVYYYLAGALELSGQTDEALAAIEQALVKQPNTPMFLNRKGWVLYHAKRYPAAEAAYRAFLKAFDKLHDDQDLREMLREARLILSNICLEQDKFPAAVEWLEQVLDEYPEHEGAFNDLSYIWSERGLHRQRALRMAEKAVAADPQNRSYRDTLGWAYFQLGKYPEALRELERAAADKEADGVIFEHLADVLAKLGRREEARKYWQQALPAIEKDGDQKRAAAIKAKLEKS